MGSRRSSGSSANPNEPRHETTADVVRDMRSATTSVLLKTAQQIVNDKVEKSKLLNLHAEERLPKVDLKDLNVGCVIGKGGFCTVYELKGFGKKSSDASVISRSLSIMSATLRSKFTRKKSATGFEISDRGSNSDNDERNDVVIDLGEDLKLSKKNQYVMKKVSTEGVDRITFLKGTVDMAMETKFLAALSHDNIITLHGTSVDGPFSEGSFLILERMKESLTKRIKTWMDVDRQIKGLTGILPGGKGKVAKLKGDKVKAALDIAMGNAYLHEKRIIFRDLKPDNIGFNDENKLKLYDFGLAKEVRKRDRNQDGLYNMTGYTGAPRFMAPEVGLKKPYNLSADVYSWSMVMWYILALEPPFGLFSPKMIEQRVHVGGDRPKLFPSWSDGITELMERGWSEEWRERPRFTEIVKVLRSELKAIDPKRVQELGR